MLSTSLLLSWNDVSPQWKSSVSVKYTNVHECTY